MDAEAVSLLLKAGGAGGGTVLAFGIVAFLKGWIVTGDIYKTARTDLAKQTLDSQHWRELAQDAQKDVARLTGLQERMADMQERMADLLSQRNDDRRRDRHEEGHHHPP